MFLRAFLITTVLLTAGLLSIYRMDPQNPFVVATDGQCHKLNPITAQDTVEIKYEHAKSQELFHIGLFGSSRVLMVGGSDIGTASGRFFNFAVGGTSLRQSVALLEALAAAKRAPKQALIGFDNMAMQFYGNAEWPPMPERMAHVYRDLIAPEVRQPLGLNARIRMAWRHVWTFWQTIRQSLSTRRLGTRIFGFDTKTETDCYRADGSRKQTESFTPTDIALQPPLRMKVPPGYLEHDMARLAALRDSEIIVFETPLAPGLVADDPISSATRTAWLAACRAHGLICISAPVTTQPVGGPYWRDASHSPAAPLGRYLADFTSEVVPPP